ncbi:type 1 glutamine amidotransferase [Vibrio nitrifigilis]|uniref:Type 1 glutamine amidotransferase n=1 Tax=Vibrio nitrifigilis TaxID=2789781 RepID=A0ABS0GET2_9VIBR|nr:type 1 glutamine amidotransferase [Vibrio nitrifigilis]MBF9000875.1 type 1 glutamine amidotransferase [Vibrio nitrifigilis]
MTPRIHYLQNLDTAGVGNITQWAQAHGYPLTGTHLYAGEPLPRLEDFDILVILGGVPQECSEWLESEILFIRQAIDANKGVVGLCLGSQLIGCAMGGELVPHTCAESGWLNVELAEKPKTHPLLSGVDSRKLFFFHRNTIVLPPVFELHASTEGCKNQIFTTSDRVIGIQSHPEMVASSIEYLATYKADNLPKGPYTTLGLIDASQDELLTQAAQFLATVLNNLVTILQQDYQE